MHRAAQVRAWSGAGLPVGRWAEDFDGMLLGCVAYRDRVHGSRIGESTLGRGFPGGCSELLEA